MKQAAIMGTCSCTAPVRSINMPGMTSVESKVDDRSDGEITIRDVVAFLRRYYVLIIVFGVIGTAAGGVAAYQNERAHTATITFQMPDAETFLPNAVWRAAYLSESSPHIHPRSGRIYVASDDRAEARRLAEQARRTLLEAAQEAIDDFRARQERDPPSDALLEERRAAGRLERWAIQLEATRVAMNRTGRDSETFIWLGTTLGAGFGLVLGLVLASLPRREKPDREISPRPPAEA